MSVWRGDVCGAFFSLQCDASAVAPTDVLTGGRQQSVSGVCG